jgi:dihydrofolate reductase
MIVSLLVAMDEGRGIGKGGALPWHLGDDLRRFKRLTMDHHIIMGRKTYESIGRPLPDRITIIITRNPDYQVDSCLVVHSLQEALELAASRNEDEAFVIGGGEIFALALPLADRIYLTRVQANLDCDVFFPPLDLRSWVGGEETFHPADEKNDFPATFQILQRVEQSNP